MDWQNLGATAGLILVSMSLIELVKNRLNGHVQAGLADISAKLDRVLSILERSK